VQLEKAILTETKQILNLTLISGKGNGVLVQIHQDDEIQILQLLALKKQILEQM
jgi:hypothetical protein